MGNAYDIRNGVVFVGSYDVEDYGDRAECCVGVCHVVFVFDVLAGYAS